MGPLVELSKALIVAGNNLLKPHSSTDAILSLLDEIESLLSIIEQDPTVSVQNALIPSMKALVSADLLRNPDSDVRVFVVSCLTEIMRITAPEAPYNDDQMKEIFQVTIEAFGKLSVASGRSYRKAVAVLDTVSKVRSSLVMLDLECDDLILDMFRQFLRIISPDHPQLVLRSMETIMITVIDESEEVSMELLEILLTTVKKESQDVSPMASRLVEKVLSRCACTLQPCIMDALKSTGTSLDMYSPVVLSACQSEAATTEAHIVVNPKEVEADEQISEELVVPSDTLQEMIDLGLSSKGSRSKRSARGGTRRVNGDEKVRNGNDLKQLLKRGQSESTDAEAESGSTRRRGRKPNSLMNSEEGYSFKTSSSKKVLEKEFGDSSLGKLAAKKASSPSKVGQTNQSVVISLSPSSRAWTGSRKRSCSKMEESNLDVGSLATPTSKKQMAKKSYSEDDLMESNLEKPEDNIEPAESSKNKRAQNGSAKTFAKKSLAETMRVKTSGKISSHSDKKKNSEGANMDTAGPQSSKSKTKNSRATTPSTKEPEQAPKSHLKRKQTAGEEAESNKSEFGEELIGKRINVWWPLDKKFYEGVINSYSSRKKTHQVSYSDGDAEELNLKKERWEIIQDIPSASEDKEIDLPESIPLSDLIRRQKGKKSKTVAMNVEKSSSPDARSSMRKKKDSVTNSTKQAKITKGALKAVSNEPESREERNLKSSKDLIAESGRTKGRTNERQKVTRAMHLESEKDCDGKEEPETKGEVEKESNAEPECMRDHQELPEEPNADIITVGEELKSMNKPNAEQETDGEEKEVAKEPDSEPKTDEVEDKSVKEPIADPKTDGEEQKSMKEPAADPQIDGKEHKSVEGPNAEPKTGVQERKSAKEPNCRHKIDCEGGYV